MLWKCQIFPLRVPVVIEMCCCVGKCPVGSQKTILSYAPIADRECHCYFLVYECWVWYEKDGTCIIRHHHALATCDKFNIFTSDPILGIFQYSLIVMSRVDFFLSDSTYVIGSRIVVVCVSHFSPLLRFFFYNRPFKTLVVGKFSEEKIVDD